MTAALGSQLAAQHEAAVSRAIDAMSDALYDEVRLDDHAAAGMYSRYHFHRIFRQVTGTTPARYLAGLRMQRAKYLLASSQHTVTTISGLVGYDSLGTFTTQFGRLVGVSPGRFRQTVDWCGDRRLDDLDLPEPRVPATALCRHSMIAALAKRHVFIGLFRGDLPIGSAVDFEILAWLKDDMLSRIRRSDSSVAGIAFALPGRTLLVDLAIGRVDDGLVGPVTAPPCDDRSADVIHLHLRPRREVDPPMVSVAAVQYLLKRFT